MDFILPWLENHLSETNPFIFAQMMVIFTLVWWKLKPHLARIEERFGGIEKKLGEMNDAVVKGFANGELRFKNLETRVEKLENN